MQPFFNTIVWILTHANNIPNHMRPGHNSLGRLQKGIEIDAEFQVVLKSVQGGIWHEALGGDQSFGGNLSIPIKKVFGMLFKNIHRNGTELMEDAPHFYPFVDVRLALGRHEK